MHIIHITSEISPIAKAGGLGDVLYGLSKKLVNLGHTVHIVLPKYDSIDYNKLQNLKVYYRDLWSYEGPYRYNNTIWSAEMDGLSLFLIEPHHPRYFFSRGTIYGCNDNIERFLYFSRAAMEFLFKSGLQPDVLHSHDWPTAIIPVLYEDMYLSLGMKKCKTILTLHNLEHQGKCATKDLSSIGLRGENYLLAAKMQDPVDLHSINLLKGGILYAQALTTVSPSYEQEIKTSKGGHGLEEILKKNQHKLQGILNGIDEDFWNPETDPHLVKNFNTHPPFTQEKWEIFHQAKKANRSHLSKLIGLEESSAPLIACITRLVPQKGPLLIAHAFRHVLSKGAQCVILGSVFSEEMQEFFSLLKEAYPSPSSGIVLLDYNEPLSHLIYAASDLFLIPSIFEPCGLTQMIALRYGTIPLVRKTGGLKDTIFDLEDANHLSTDRNGFVFENPTAEDLTQTLDRALECLDKNPHLWHTLLEQGMSKDFSWTTAAKKYIDLYEKK